MAIQLMINGEPREVPAGATVDIAVAAVTGQSKVSSKFSGVAAAVNGEVVPRGTWPGTALRDGDRVEVVTALLGS